jgi:hypothetical protein
MPSGSSAIANYEAMAHLIKIMGEAAGSHDWERLVELENDYVTIAERMRLADISVSLTDQEIERKNGLIEEILAGDRIVREHVEAWMSKFRENRQLNKQKRRIDKAYSI